MITSGSLSFVCLLSLCGKRSILEPQRQTLWCNPPLPLHGNCPFISSTAEVGTQGRDPLTGLRGENNIVWIPIQNTLVWFVYQITQPEPCIRRSHGTHKDIPHAGPSAVSMTTLHHSNIIRDATKLLHFVLIPKHQLCESVMIWWYMTPHGAPAPRWRQEHFITIPPWLVPVHLGRV